MYLGFFAHACNSLIFFGGQLARLIENPQRTEAELLLASQGTQGQLVWIQVHGLGGPFQGLSGTYPAGVCYLRSVLGVWVGGKRGGGGFSLTQALTAGKAELAALEPARPEADVCR